MDPARFPLSAVTPAELCRVLPTITLAEARKIVSAVQRGLSIEGHLDQVRRTTMELVRARCDIPTLAVVARSESRVDPFVKLLLEAKDGARFETVRIPLEKAGRFSVCVSSQVGCALACAFCATGRMGLVRNLETWEIVEQVRAVRRTFVKGQRAHGVVFQGMGEPLANLDRVLEAIRIFSDPSTLAIDARAITVCTAGLPSGILRLAAVAPNVRLGVSIASAVRGDRKRLMPIDGKHSLEDVIAAAVTHATLTRNAPLFAITLLANQNDSVEHADALADLVLSFTARAGLRPRLSIIPYNRTSDDDDPFERTNDLRERAFRDALAARGVFSHKRYSGGGDVAAACGQLVAS